MPVKTAKILKLWLPVVFVMAVIFRASSLPASDIPPVFAYQDIVFHFLIYLLLAYFFARGLINTNDKIPYLWRIFFTFFFVLLYALSDEFHQSFVPGRDPSLFDIFIDSIGSISGAIIYR